MGIPTAPAPVTEVSNGDFGSAVDWTVGAWWTIAGGIASILWQAGPWDPFGYLTQQLYFQADHLYRFKWDIFNCNFTPPNSAGVNLFGHLSPQWIVPGTYEWYVTGKGPFPWDDLVLIANLHPIVGDSFSCDNITVIDCVQHMLINYGLNTADVNYVEFNLIAGTVYQFVISNFSTPQSIWIKADVSEF